MLFGESTSEADAFLFLSTASDHDINIFDTAEMYPVPQRAQTQGLSEIILGKWLKSHKRTDFIVSTKVAGPGGMDWLRQGPLSLDTSNITRAIDDSLLRLQTDYIDIALLHWPDRSVPMFGGLDYDSTETYPFVPFDEQAEALYQALRAGKIRHYGLSNETPYGFMKFCELSSRNPSVFPKPVTIQNAYSLTCRTFDIALAECCHLENVSLMAYSPLAMGLLTGKYLASGGPPAARLNKYKGRYAEAESRYGPKPNVKDAVSAYAALARENGMTPAALAMKFVLSHPLLSTVVTGVTSIEQLQELLQIWKGECHSPEVLQDNLRQEIDAIHRKYPNPTP